MGALYIFVLGLLTTVTAEKNVPIKDVSSIKADTEIITNSAVEKNSFNVEGSGEADLSKSMELILFRPYFPELKDLATQRLNNLKAQANNSELSEPHGDTILDAKTEKHSNKHINKRNVDQEYTEDIKSDIKSDHPAKIDDTSKPFARYEITENVIDVPDDRTPAGPVIHNYSPYRNTLLNLGSPKNDTEVKTEIADEDAKHTKSRVSILHIKAEIEEKPNEPSKIKNFFKGVKNYLSGIKTDVVKGISKLFKHDETPHGKDFEGSDECDEEDEEKVDDDDDEDDDDFAELHKTIHKGFR